MKQFIITGCARSGTQYMSQLLNSIGCDCKGESFYNLRYTRLNDEMTRFLEPDDMTYSKTIPVFGQWGEASWLATPYLKSLPIETVVLHQVRAPIDVIRSKVRIGFFNRPKRVRTLAFALQHCPEIDGGTFIDQAAKYWYYWNLRTEEAMTNQHITYFRYRLEDMDLPLIKKIISLIGYDCAEEGLLQKLEQVPKDFNTRGDKSNDENCTLGNIGNELLKRQIIELSDKYGYTQS